jgi:Ca2+-transporting ATPase
MVLFQSFNVFNARSDERSAFRELFTNGWLWLAIILSVVLQAAVVYLPLLQRPFSTVGLSLGDWLRCAAVASSVLWLREISKAITRADTHLSGD